MNKENQRTRQTIRFLKWIRKYSGWWHLICTPGDEHMDLKMMRMLIERLKDEAFYELIFVLITVHREEPFMKGFSDYMMLDILAEVWNRDNETIINNMIAYLE